MLVQGHAAIVTGGGSGLGAASAKALAAKGAKVAVMDYNADAAKAVAAECGGLGLGCDVSDGPSTEAAFAAARTAHGPARIVVHCAGVATPGRIFGKDGPGSLKDFERVIAVNLTGTFNILRLAAYDMSKLEALSDGERGVIINTASVAAFEGQIGQCAYASSKGGVASMMLPAARELARFGIRVIAVAPGLFGTPMLLGMPQQVQDGLAASVPFPVRFGRPEEYADLVLFAVGNQMMNGSTVRLDGALRMQPK